MARALTAKSVENLRPGVQRREIPDRTPLLYLCVQPSGRRRFVLRYRTHGQSRKVTLQAGLTLSSARKIAADAALDLERGIDPRDARRAAKQKAADAAKDTLQAICAEYLHREGRHLRSVAQIKDILERLVFPVLGARPIESVRRSEIVRLLDGIEDRCGPVQADRTLGVVRRICNWHAGRSDTFNSPIVRGMGRTKPASRARSRVLADDELQRVWATAGATPGPFGPLVRFLLLTAARRNEASGLRGPEITTDGWLLPAVRSKTKADLLRPLSQAAQTLLSAQPSFVGCDYVFTSDGRRPIAGFSKPKRLLDAASGTSGWTLHDLRRTARSLMSRAGVSADVAERCLGHAIPGVRGVYDRHRYQTEMLHAFEALAAQIERVVDPKENVIALRGATP